jgi:hypothetical protein
VIANDQFASPTDLEMTSTFGPWRTRAVRCTCLLLARNGPNGGRSARQLSGKDRPRQPFTGAAVDDPKETLTPAAHEAYFRGFLEIFAVETYSSC